MISRVSIINCKCYEINSSSIQKWYANTTSYISSKDFGTFMKKKSSYTQEKLLKNLLKEYYLEIKIFMKQDDNILPNYKSKNHKIKLLKGKQALFVWNYKPLSEHKIKTIKKYINKHLGKDFIRPSLSAAAVPVLLVRKPDNRLKFCIDYKSSEQNHNEKLIPNTINQQNVRKIIKYCILYKTQYNLCI